MRTIKFRVWNKTVYPEMLKSSVISLNNTGWINITQETNGGIDQYTGLKDKNGVEIWENDIVKEDNCKDIVVWFDELQYDCGGGVHSGFYLKESEGALEYMQNLDEFEVIGNIHENPELLK